MAFKDSTLERLGKGLELIILGYFFKVIIADNCASLSDSVYSNPAAASVLSTYVGVLGFSVQLYFDFLGYTHIARGSSLLFNLQLPINFNHPFHSANMPTSGNAGRFRFRAGSMTISLFL